MSYYPPPPPPIDDGVGTSCEGGGNVTLGSIACYDTDVSGQSLISSLIIDSILGLLCFFGFVLWRGSFYVYHGRESVRGDRKPPTMKLGGHWQIWSWLIPTWNTTDKEFLLSAGFDSLVAIRVITLGIAIFIPFTFFGIAVLLPLNYTGGFLDEQNGSSSSANLTNTFLKMTVSNIQDGSSKIWVHFVFLCLFIGWVCYLLLIFYEEHIAMHHTLTRSNLDKIAAASQEFEGEDEDDAGDAGDDDSKVKANEKDNGGGHSYSQDEEMKGAEEVETTTTLHTAPSKKKSIQSDEMRIGASPAIKLLDESPSSRERTYNLWPIRRVDVYPPMRSYQAFLGLYAVLVIDNPPRKFTMGKTKRLFGMPLTVKEEYSLLSVQSEVERIDDTYYWQKSFVTKTTANVSSSKECIAPPEATTKGDASEAAASPNDNATWGEWWRDFRSARFGEKAELRKKHRIEGRMKVVDETFKRLFGDDYDQLVPVFPTKKMDACLTSLLDCQGKVERAMYALNQAIASEEKISSKKNSEKSEKLAQKIEKLRERLAKLQSEEAEKQKAAETLRASILQGTPCESFFAVFHSAKAASMAVNLNCNPLSWKAFRFVQAPDPENINFPTIQRSYWHRQYRRILGAFLISLMMLFPIGLISGAFSQLNAALCGGAEGTTGSLTGTWYCSDNIWAQLIRGIITGFLPSILMTVYQSVVLPMYIVMCCQAESQHFSLSALDRRAGQLFFTWNMVNFFLGALLGGAVTNAIRSAISNPRSIISLLGSAVPASSNFFISYVMYRALTMTSFRLFFPHSCVFPDICKWFRVLPQPKTEMDKAAANPLRNCRFSRDLSIPIGTVYLAALAYCVIAPFILPFAFIFFVLIYFVWRYQQLYVYQSMYNCRGQYWMFMAHRIMACLTLTSVFSGAVFLVKHAYVQGGLAILLVAPVCLIFDKYLSNNYDSIYESLPVAILEAAPRLEVDHQSFVAAPLRPRAEQWFLQWGTVWEFFGINRYNL